MFDILREPDLVLLDRKPLKRKGRYLEGAQAQLELRQGEVWVSAPKGAAFFTLRWHGELPRGARILGDAFERSYGDLEWRGAVPERVMPWYCAVYTEEGCFGYGVKVRPNAFCYWQCDQAGVTLTLDVRSGTRPIVLEEALCAAKLVYHSSEEKPFAFLKAFCVAMSDEPLTAPYPVYGSNSWYYCYSPSNRELMRKDAALLQELTQGLPQRPFAVVDCGWPVSVKPEDPTSGTVMARGNQAFGDMRALADDIKAYGVRPGIWLRPLCISNGSVVDEHLLIKRDPVYEYPCLDPSMPQALDIVAADVRRAVQDWGYEMIKVDFLTHDVLFRFHDHATLSATRGELLFNNPTLTTAQVFKNLHRTIRDNAGDALIIGCNAISHLASGYFHLNRTGDDTSGKEFERSRYYGVNTLAFRLCQHKAFYDVDADCFGQTGDMPWALNRQWLELLAKSGTPLFVSIHPDEATPEQKQALRESYARAARQTDVMEPLDFMDTTCPGRYLVNGEELTFDWMGESGVVDFGVPWD